MELSYPLVSGTLVRRYKRFLADVQLGDGSTITVHTPNSGSMMGCAIPGSPVLLSLSPNPGRKYPHTWELVQVGGTWIGVNTGLPPHLTREGIENGTVSELQGYSRIRAEVPYGESRLDLLLEGDKPPCWIEVKNVTLVEQGHALFPDAVTTRGQKHLRELMRIVKGGEVARSRAMRGGVIANYKFPKRDRLALASFANRRDKVEIKAFKIERDGMVRPFTLERSR